MKLLTMFGWSVFATAALAQNVDSPKQWREGGILVTEGDIGNCPYRVVLEVEANVHSTTIFGKRPSDEKVIREMRQRAGKVGAEAIVHARISPLHATAVWGKVVTGSGQAVRYEAPCVDPRITR